MFKIIGFIISNISVQTKQRRKNIFIESTIKTSDFINGFIIIEFKTICYFKLIKIIYM